VKLIWTPKVFSGSVILAATALALAYASSGFYILAGVMVIMGVLWLLDHEQRWNYLASFALVLIALFCALGYWLQVYMPLLVVSLTAGLAAWDLDHFTRRVKDNTPVEHLHRMEKQHIQQLLVVCGIGLLIAEGTLLIEIQLGFWTVFGAALVVLFGLNWAIGLIRRGV
jgi:hypothetical protein